MKNSISFFLMNKKGYIVLKSLIERKKQIAAVVSSQDPALKNDYYIEIKNLCKENDIFFFDRNDKFDDQITSSYIITIGWRWLIKGNLQKKLIVTHDSILPKYRGFAPLVNMLINGETQLGVSLLLASDEYDTGNIIMQKTQNIKYPMKIIDALEIVSELFVNAILDIYRILDNGKSLEFFPQDENSATYSLWRNDDDYLIDFSKNALEIRRFVDAVGYPYFGAKAYIRGNVVRILEVETIKDVVIENRDNGKVIFVKNGFPVIVCGTGLLLVKKMVDESGKNILPLTSFRTIFRGK